MLFRSGLIENLHNFILGIAFDDKIISFISTDIGEVSFSDNSYLLFMITFGVPFCFAFIILFIMTLQRILVIKKNILILGYFIFTLFLYNAILWDIWLFNFFVTLFLVQYCPEKNKRECLQIQ